MEFRDRNIREIPIVLYAWSSGSTHGIIHRVLEKSELLRNVVNLERTVCLTS